MKILEFDEGTKENRRPYASLETLRALQTAVYVMCGGGWLGDTAAHSPYLFYIDDRVGGLPYRNREVMQAVKALIQEAEILGLDPKSLPSRPKFHSCGIF